MIYIKVRCKGSIDLPLDDLHILQDVGNRFVLKELSKSNFEKLRKSLETDGFWFPFFVWKNNADKKWYYLDGTQRDKVLRWMQTQPKKYQLPEKFPCAEIEANSMQEAAVAILKQSSAYGKITDEGLYAFIEHFKIQDNMNEWAQQIELPWINLPEFIGAYYDDFDVTIIDGDYEANKKDHDYGAHSTPFRFSDIIAFIDDQQLTEKMKCLSREIIEKYGEDQKIFNDIGIKMVKIILDHYEDIFS